MEEPDSENTTVPVDSPFAINLTNALWLGGAVAVILTLVALSRMGVIQ